MVTQMVGFGGSPARNGWGFSGDSGQRAARAVFVQKNAHFFNRKISLAHFLKYNSSITIKK